MGYGFPYAAIACFRLAQTSLEIVFIAQRLAGLAVAFYFQVLQFFALLQ